MCYDIVIFQVSCILDIEREGQWHLDGAFYHVMHFEGEGGSE